jgi:cupin fold WbuC family metalloprotein
MSETRVSYIDRALLDGVLAEAAALPRKRKNFNFHERSDHPCQRLVNAVLPGSYIRAHRHLHADKSEMLVALRGRLGIVFFDEAGNVTSKAVLDAAGDTVAVNIPNGQYHTAVALGTPVVVFEAKAGPYAPHMADELAPFSPAEDSADAPAYLRRMEALFDGA